MAELIKLRHGAPSTYRGVQGREKGQENRGVGRYGYSSRLGSPVGHMPGTMASMAFESIFTGVGMREEWASRYYQSAHDWDCRWLVPAWRLQVGPRLKGAKGEKVKAVGSGRGASPRTHHMFCVENFLFFFG